MVFLSTTATLSVGILYVYVSFRVNNTINDLENNNCEGC